MVLVLAGDSHHQRNQQKGQVSYNLSQLIFLFVVSPDPGAYNLPSDFDIGRPGTTRYKTKPGLFTFGCGRKEMEKVFVGKGLANSPDRSTPGPGTY